MPGQHRLRVAFLPLGQDNAPTRRAVSDARAALAGLPFRLFGHPPVFEEAAVLDAVDALSEHRPHALVVFHTRGSSARTGTLAVHHAKLPAVLWCRDTDYALPSSALAVGALHDLSHPVYLLHGDHASAPFRHELRAALNAACAVTLLARSRIGTIGPIHPNLTSVCIDPWMLLQRLGVWVTPISLPEVESALKSIVADRLPSHIRSLRRHADLSGLSADILKAAAALDLALLDLARSHRLDAFAVDCWHTFFPHFRLSPCTLFVHDTPLLACEGDPVLAASLIIARALTGAPAYVGDIYSLDETSGALTSRHCGFPCLEGKPALAEATPPSCSQDMGTVVSVRPPIRVGRGTLFLISGSSLDSLHVAPCRILGLDTDAGCTLRLKLTCHAPSFRQHLRGNHYLILPGDHRRELRLLGGFLKMTVLEQV